MDAPARPTAYEFGEYLLDVRQRSLRLSASRRPLPLNARTFDTLLFLLEHPGRVLDKSTLMAAIWPNVVVEENNLNQHISALRRVLGERPEEHRFIVTVPGQGYQFVAPVHAVTAGSTTPLPEAPGAEVPPVSAQPTGARIDAAPQQPASGIAQITGARWAFGAAGLLLAIALVWGLTSYLAGRLGGKIDRPPAITSIDVEPIRKLRLAVLPFENLSPDPKNAFFADGLHEEIVSTIAREVPGVEVISRTTMLSYRAIPPKPLAAVARELRATHLMEGSVRREGNTVRLTLRLIDARTDGPIWSASYDRTLANALTLESQVAEAVSAQMPARLARPEQTAAPLRDTAAFDLYLKALLALRTFVGDSPTYHQIEELLGGVIAREPGFALAYAQRARARTILFIGSLDTSDTIVRQIRADIDTAQRLAPKDPIVLAVNGFFLMCANDTSGALEAYAAAEAAGLAEPEWLLPKAQLLLRRSRIEEFNATVQRSLALDPADPLVISFAAYHYFTARQPLDALQAIEYARIAFPSLYAAWRAFILLEFTGQTEALRSFLEHYKPVNESAHLTDSIPLYFQLLQYEHRYVELRALIDRVPVASSTYYAGVDVGPVGQTPTALLRGWTDLLLNDRASALKDGRAVLHFVERQASTKWNAAYLDGLKAAGYTFIGDCVHARALGDSTLRLVPRSDNAVVWTSMATHVARVDAWCGGAEQAIALLRQLSSGRPGVGPAAITLDPLLAVPLGQLPAYQVLSAQLETAIRSARLEFGKDAVVTR